MSINMLRQKARRMNIVTLSVLTTIISHNTSAAQSFTHEPGTEYEVILYDAETITRINTPTASPTNIQADQTNSLIPSTDLALTSSSTYSLPRDISAEFIDVIAGVPIMKDPQSCGKGLLEIGVTIDDVETSKGMIVADLHDDKKENFLVWDEVILRVRATPIKGETKFCMPLTKPGDYAIAIYHDKNGNKEFDKNFLGIPSEHFGMSNNPKFGLKSPSYEEAVFSVPQSGKNIRITLFKAGDILGGQKQ